MYYNIVALHHNECYYTLTKHSVLVEFQMNTFTDLLKPEAFFSDQNAFFKTAKQAHELTFRALDKSIRLQLDFTRDLMDLNRERFEALYAGESVMDTLSAQKDFALATGKRGLSLVDDAQAIANEIQEAIKETANDFVASANSFAKAPKTTTRKAKAA